MTETTLPWNPSDSKLGGPNILLMGPAGTGKTDSLGTIPSTLNTRYMSLEKGLESLLNHYKRTNKPVPANLAWHHITPPKSSFKEMRDMAVKIGTIPMETLLKMPDTNKARYDMWETMLSAMSDFPDDRTGKKLGAVDDWGPGDCLVIDGLTGLNQAILQRVVGGKPVKSPQDWGVAQDQLEGFLRMLTTHCRCWIIVLAHVEREVDMVLGGNKITVSSLGKALPPKIPAMFSDVILATREATTWTWDTVSSQAEIKARNLPWKSGLAPDFGAIYENWKSSALSMETAQSPT